jgi:tryptophan synthase beta subunit
MSPDQTIIVNVSGRGDKDVDQVKEIFGRKND